MQVGIVGDSDGAWVSASFKTMEILVAPILCDYKLFCANYIFNMARKSSGESHDATCICHNHYEFDDIV